MGRVLSKKRRSLLITVVCVFLALCMMGCGDDKKSEEKVRDLEFTVVGQNDLPLELAEIIGQKKKEPFRLTYTSGSDLYIAVGYGEQKSGGYSIAVPELYLTDNSIVIRTELKGPEKEEATGTEPSYPFVTVKTEFIEKPVVFQ